MALTKLDIATAGLRQLNEVGLGALTLQRIATELGVRAPALYWHVANKQELLDEMATQMMRECGATLPTAEVAVLEGWEVWLRLLAQRIREMLLQYRDGAKVFCGTFLTDPAVPDPNLLRPLLDAGFATADAGRAWYVVYSFVIGFTIEEQAVHPEPGRMDERYQRLVEERGGGDEASIEQWAFTGSPDDRFGELLDVIMAGITASLRP